MKVHTSRGSKERLIEMMKGVNKDLLNEELRLEQSNPDEAIVSTVLGQIQDQTIKITNSDSMKKDDGTYADLVGKDDVGNQVKINLVVPPKEGDIDGVFTINKADLRQFDYQKADGEVISLDANSLGNINANNQDALIDIAGNYVQIDSDGEEASAEMYEDAVKWIDTVPYKGGSERLQTQKAYGDEKPTNPEVRVDSPELDKFVSEREATTVDTDALSGEDLIKAKYNVLVADLEFTKLAQAYENFLKIKRIDFEPSEVIQTALSSARDLIAEYLRDVKGLDVTGEDVQNFFQSWLTQYSKVVNEGPGHGLKRDVILKAFHDLVDEKGVQPTREEVRIRAQNMMDIKFTSDQMNEENKYPDPIGGEFKSKGNKYPKPKKKIKKTVDIKEGDDTEVEVGTKPNAPDVVNLDAEIGDKPADVDEIPDGGADSAMMSPDAPSAEDMAASFDDFQAQQDGSEVVGDDPEDVEQVMQDKDDAGDELEGGLADDKSAFDFCPKQIAKGIEVEMEHTSNPLIAIEIVMDHLVEDPQYYGTDDEDPEAMAQKGAEADADDEVADELLGFSPHNVGDVPEVPEDEEDTEETNVLLGYKPQNVGDYEGEEVSEIDSEESDATEFQDKIVKGISDDDDEEEILRKERQKFTDDTLDKLSMYEDGGEKKKHSLKVDEISVVQRGGSRETPNEVETGDKLTVTKSEDGEFSLKKEDFEAPATNAHFETPDEERVWVAHHLTDNIGIPTNWKELAKVPDEVIHNYYVSGLKMMPPEIEAIVQKKKTEQDMKSLMERMAETTFTGLPGSKKKDDEGDECAFVEKKAIRMIGMMMEVVGQDAPIVVETNKKSR